MEARGNATPASGRWQCLRRLLVASAVALFLILLAYGLLTKAPNDSIDASLAKSHPSKAPGFDLPILQRGMLGTRLSSKIRHALADGDVSLTELRGTPVVLNFWASWCVPCRQEAPILERAWDRERGEGVLFVGLNMQDLSTDARAFLRDFHNTYLNIRDQGSDTAHSWGVTGVPETFFITATDRVVAHVIGVVSPAQLSQGIAAMQSGRAFGTLTGGATRPTR
jgi:cytochrome c biogenesis protein CcmG, thiol:disulfide interchange protein DsbE